MRRRIPDTTRIHELIGWIPKIGLDQTILDIVSQFKSDGLSADSITERPVIKRVVVD